MISSVGLDIKAQLNNPIDNGTINKVNIVIILLDFFIFLHLRYVLFLFYVVEIKSNEVQFSPLDKFVYEQFF